MNEKKLICPFRDGKCKDDCMFVYRFEDTGEKVCGFVLLIEKIINQAS